jgi:hypothetical protein
MITEEELRREARRVLRQLSGPRTVLVRRDDGGFVVAWRGVVNTGSMQVEAPVVAALRTRDWIVPRGTVPESFALSDAGTGWLRRTEADGDPYAAQHRVVTRRKIIDQEGIERIVHANDGESPLGWLHQRQIIDHVQFAAGERLRRDYTLAQLAPRLGVDLSAPIVLGRRGAKRDAPLAETVLGAKQRFRRAMKVVGPGLSDLLYDVCCHLVGLEEIEKEKDWPQRSGKVVLNLALDRLATHYGLRVTAPSSGPIRSWQMD